MRQIYLILWDLWLFESQLANFGCSVPWGRKLWCVKFYEAWNLNPQKQFQNIMKGENAKFLQVEIVKIYNHWQTFFYSNCFQKTPKNLPWLRKCEYLVVMLRVYVLENIVKGAVSLKVSVGGNLTLIALITCLYLTGCFSSSPSSRVLVTQCTRNKERYTF